MLVSIIMPCLDEGKTVASSIKSAIKAVAQSGYRSEIILCDNGSSDDSVKLATSAGARVVFESKVGYGYACQTGLKSANGKFLIVGDPDGSYDFSEIPKFIQKLNEGCDFVSGTRLNGKIFPGSMPWSHRYIGSPILSWLLNKLHRTNLTDVYCGLKAFNSKSYKKMNLRSSGMEFALELTTEAIKHNLKICEVPISYHPRVGRSKLSPLKDGLQGLFFLINGN